MDSVTLKQIGWYFEGEAIINFWGGGQGTVDMTPWTIEGELDDEKMKKGINDGQFGCEGIDRVEIHVYKLYEHEYKVYWELIELVGDDLN